MRSDSKLGTALGVLAFVIGFVGYTVFGWRFGGGTESPVAFVLGVVAVAVAIGLTVRDRL